MVGLYDSTESRSLTALQSRIHRFAAMPLNHLGFVIDYWDITQGLPPENLSANAWGIVTWFEDDVMKGAAEYLEWAAGQMESGKRFVVLGKFGAMTESAGSPDQYETALPAPAASVSRFFARLGVEYDGESTENALELSWGKGDRSMTEFEVPRAGRPQRYEGVRLLRDQTGRVSGESYLKVIRRNVEADVVAVTPSGGYVLDGFAVQSGNDSERWRIDPFRFFEAALGSAELPKLDPTTMTGRRIFYTHIDGDGVNNQSRFEKGVWAGEAVYRDLIQPFDFPVTASFIITDIDPSVGGSERSLALARKMYADPKVHPASHTFTHPFDWDRKITASSVPGYSRPISGQADQDILYGSSYLKGAVITASDEEFEQRETAASCRTLQTLADPHHRPGMLFWSGNCRPPEGALEALDKEGLLNLNGGDTRFDRLYPSYTTVAPFSAPVGRYRQIYSSNANENLYTDLWHAHFGNYVYVIQTFLNTERPRGLGSRKPARRTSAANVYYHFYTGERQSAIRGTAKALQFAAERDWAAVTAADYVRVVKGFLEASVTRDGDGWKVSGYGPCRTLRLDGTTRYPDLARSVHVMGFHEWAGHFYVHLDEADEARLVLTTERPTQMYLESASGAVRSFEGGERQVTLRVSSERAIDALVANAAPGAVYEGGWRDAGGASGDLSVTADGSGRLALRLPAARDAAIHLTRTL